MSSRDTAPTKTNLIKLKRSLSFAKEGYELLDQKRNILIHELMSLIERTIAVKEKVYSLLEEAYRSLEISMMKTGKERLKMLALSVNIKAEAEFSSHRVMGVELPEVKTAYEDSQPYFSLNETDFTVDETLLLFRKALSLVGEYAQTQVSMMRLAMEVKKTIRKVNALEKIAIPDYRATIKFIEDRLEETEREEFYLLKLLKRSI